ncbi:MAG: hypothetical protein ACNA8H_00515 [Anaerolineales bacterium]
MSKENLFTKIIKSLQSFRQKLGLKPAAQQNGDAMAKLIHMLENTDERELSCDEVFAIIDQYAELESGGEDAPSIFPLVKKHLDNCHDCLEEYESLSQILATTPMQRN